MMPTKTAPTFSPLRTIDDSTSTIKGHFKVSVENDPDEFRLYTVSAATEASGYHKSLVLMFLVVAPLLLIKV